ncbi:hypothetical protein PAAG_05573 [Paracoccidioides lutzii Pb01]|uniref:Glycosyl transferase CAP10 domain-containing protein n=1 Tax=Paracoccidioides lutzii (strain ATCC MYA-826 / Pb01) TaxID=502779 RepID=C1H480_PARBA|nr:hypothetical protein PAAG_05573 [Paracoccidioides lutzii Pb01]EEH34524.2 hypothetical protein PAAG_05573 [Paracoccidioides lutzii Pb01]
MDVNARGMVQRIASTYVVPGVKMTVLMQPVSCRFPAADVSRNNLQELYQNHVGSQVRKYGAHLWCGTNNHTSNPVSILLPSWSSSKENPTSCRYINIPASSVSTTLDLQTSVFLTDKVTRCSIQDCNAQTSEFGLGPSIDPQEHWKYRFLMDADRASFSGRFLPFLQSRNLPFPFRTNRRLTPWHHFVPIDVQLHGLWNSLAYFSGARIVDSNAPDAGTDAGLNNEKSSCDITKIKNENAEEKLSKTTINTNRNGDDDCDNHKILMYPHTRKGEFIAEEGCKRAEKVLRKEDMEIYMFRPLLEWERLTDDKMELGFQI